MGAEKSQLHKCWNHLAVLVAGGCRGAAGQRGDGDLHQEPSSASYCPA